MLETAVEAVVVNGSIVARDVVCSDVELSPGESVVDSVSDSSRAGGVTPVDGVVAFARSGT